jgi:type IX secretion system PorP/SprF family membrane protein
MKTRHKMLRLCFFLLCPFLWSQQEAAFSLYMFNHQSINPAYVGAQNSTQFTLVNRTQWDGIVGAPETQAISVGHQFESKNVGFGLSSVIDKIGPSQNTSVALDFSYHLKLNDKNLKLGLGIKASGRSYQLNNSMISPFDSSDLVLSSQINNKFSPNIGAGLYLHNQKFYLGIAIPNFLEDEEIFYKRNYYMFFGGLINMNQSIKFKPSFLVQKTELLPLTYDASVLIVVRDKFWIGPQLRTTVSAGRPDKNNAGFYGAIAGVHVGENMTIGYAYQGSSLNKNIGITNNSHELFLRFQLASKTQGILRSPRIF